MNFEGLSKDLAQLRRHKDKEIKKKENDLLICYCRWVHVEKRDRGVIYVEKKYKHWKFDGWC